LHDDFVARPGGMFLVDFDDYPAWETFSGYKNQLAFSLVQSVSHTQVMMYSDLAMLFLRFAQITAPEFAENNDAVNYYLGQYFYTNKGNYKAYFDKISSSSPFKLFATHRIAERTGDTKVLMSVLEQNPLFVPAINTVVSKSIKQGDKRTALRVVNRALKSENISEIGRSFLYKTRAQIYYVFGNLGDAQSDLHTASSVLGMDADILSLQAKIWAAQNREIENAYEYAMGLVRQNPSDVFAWDTLGRVVATREGTESALELISRVGDVSNTCSSLFEFMGDLYERAGDCDRARQSYMRAIDLSDDGMVIVPNIERKLRKLK
jgi:tetratricopeptide (TPR) repeat protein